jgi:hypothetical protein
MIKVIIIFILSLTTIIFATLFTIYYNNIDKYMKDKENEIIRRETNVAKKEDLIKKYEQCNNELNNIKVTMTKIKDLSNIT